MLLAIDCPEGMVFNPNGNPCQPTCVTRSTEEQANCDQAGHVEMCVCIEHFKLDGYNCVPEYECPACEENGDMYKVSSETQSRGRYSN